MRRDISPDLIVVFCLFCAAWPAAMALAQQHKPWSEYEVLVTHNMFTSSRGTPLAVAAQPADVPPPPPPESYIVLRGAVGIDGRFVAVFEDMRSGEVLHVAADEELFSGRIASVDLDAVVYACEQGELRVAIGESLARGATPGGPGAMPATVTPATGEASDILERLRRRRQSQLEQ